MKKALCFILVFLMVNSQFSIVYAQENEQPISEMQSMMQESAEATQQPANETVYDDNLTPQQRFEQNPTHNVHTYDYKQQVVVGGVVMFCVALAMIANNNYNPKKLK